MGAIYTFKCNNCSYDVESCGNLDYGLFGVWRPFICNDCNIITDTLVGQHGVEYQKEWIENPKSDDVPQFMYININEEEKDDYYTCEKCNGKNLTVWNPKWRKCPKCGHRMIKGSEIALWD